MIVRWLDPATQGGWHSDVTQFGPGVVQQVGIVHTSTRNDGLIIMSSYLDETLCGDPTFIPWGCIDEVWVLEAGVPLFGSCV